MSASPQEPLPTLNRLRSKRRGDVRGALVRGAVRSTLDRTPSSAEAPPQPPRFRASPRLTHSGFDCGFGTLQEALVPLQSLPGTPVEMGESVTNAALNQSSEGANVGQYISGATLAARFRALDGRDDGETFDNRHWFHLTNASTTCIAGASTFHASTSPLRHNPRATNSESGRSGIKRRSVDA